MDLPINVYYAHNFIYLICCPALLKSSPTGIMLNIFNAPCLLDYAQYLHFVCIATS